MTTCREIIEKHLRDNGFDGLVHLDTECGCHLDDFVICGHIETDCEPAYKHDEGGDWVMKLYAESDH